MIDVFSRAWLSVLKCGVKSERGMDRKEWVSQIASTYLPRFLTRVDHSIRAVNNFALDTHASKRWVVLCLYVSLSLLLGYHYSHSPSSTIIIVLPLCYNDVNIPTHYWHVYISLIHPSTIA